MTRLTALHRRLRENGRGHPGGLRGVHRHCELQVVRDPDRQKLADAHDRQGASCHCYLCDTTPPLPCCLCVGAQSPRITIMPDHAHHQVVRSYNACLVQVDGCQVYLGKDATNIGIICSKARTRKRAPPPLPACTHGVFVVPHVMRLNDLTLCGACVV